MSSAVIRVKRRAEDTPQDALVLLSKRLKTEPVHDDADSDLSLNVFLFSSTVEQNEIYQVKSLRSHVDKKEYSHSTKNTSEILKKVRRDHKETSTESRYKVLKLSRGLNDATENDDGCTVVDVTRTISEDEKDVQFAYDLYVSQKEDFDLSILDNVLRVQELDDQIFSSYRDNGRRTPSDKCSESSDDSNDENNWRNEYPDTENSSVSEEDMRKAVEDIDIGGDLSSDADEEEIYNEPAIDLNDLNVEDVQRYGLSYAKYKARVLSGKTDIEDKKNFVYCTEAKDSGDESSEGYKDNEDGFYYGMDEDTEQFASQYKDASSEDDLPD